MFSAWKAVEIAMAYVSPTLTKMPTMSEVVAKLKEYLASDLAQRDDYEDESNYSVEMVNKNMITELNPFVR
jgi:hypothetical protein